jgi:hypothetical protein
LRNRTDGGSWERGVGYHEGGRVLDLAVDGQAVIARVMGTHRYKVELWADEGRIFGDCTCPMGDRGVFCKHCVATGLQCIEDGITELGEEGHVPEEPDDGAVEADRRVTDFDGIREYLRGVETEDLIEIVVEQAKSDESLMRRLRTEVAESRGLGPDVETFKGALRDACSVWDFVEYSEAWSFASGIDDVVDEIEELLEEGYAEEVVELCEYGIEEVENAFAYVDDSSGSLGMTLNRLQDLHLRACRSADLDRERLGEWLFCYELTSDYGSVSGAVKAYAEVLGEDGLAKYRRLAEEQWEDYPRLGPGDERELGSNRFTMERIMESLAELTGEPEQLVEIKKRDLSHPSDYLDIARVYKEERQYNEAMEWAEKGLEAFPDSKNSRLRSFLATEYSRRGRHEEATELAWENFVNRLQRQGYRLIITGSNAHLLSSELATHLTGRHVQIVLFPFSFAEYVDAFEKELTATEKAEAFWDYLEVGGYPEPLVKDINRREYLTTLVRSILYKDIVVRHGIRAPQGLEDLATYLMSNVAQEYSCNTLSKVTRLKSEKTVEKYLRHLEEAFLFFPVGRFSFKVREQVRAPRKIYCTDNGLVTSTSFRISADRGKLGENAVAIELRKRALGPGLEFYTWKGPGQKEVDFVVKEGPRIRELIQVCVDISNPKTRDREVRALVKASEELRCENLLVLTGTTEGEEVSWFGHTGRVRFQPMWKWFLESE